MSSEGISISSPPTAAWFGPGSPGFREFLRAKAEESGLEDRHRLRRDWTEAIQLLLNRIEDWLRKSDPDGILDVQRFEIARTEPRLGTYDAPAMLIRLGPAEVKILPMERDVSFYTIRGASGKATEFAGRVDVTDGYRKYSLFREAGDAGDRWQVQDERNRFTDLDSQALEGIFKDLLS